MKNVPCKDGVIFYYVKKYRFKRLVTVLVLILILFLYSFLSRAYLMNAFFGAENLDEKRFSQEISLIDVPEPFEMHRSESVAIESYTLKAKSYWQDMNYEFNVKLEKPQKTDIGYTTANTDSTVEDKTMDSAVIYKAVIGGVDTVVLAYPHDDFKNGDVVCGVFTEIPRIIAHDIAKSESFEAEEKICRYMLDTRGISMESQFADIVICVSLLALVLYLGIRLAVQYINPLTSPTYKGIDKYGSLYDTVEKIERQLLEKMDGKKIKGEIVTENWIVSRDTFKLKIVKNHMQKH